ncbi:MAG: molybdenum cofactor guanylyltransferase [Synechocystis sp.]|nr:molybdenum cofactor guanylyltransferase [Synechocystis sp.]
MDNSPSQVTVAIILAGGNSTRMGQDKALLTWHNTCLLRETCLKALALTDQVYVVTPWGERYEPLLPSGCSILPEDRETNAPGPLVAFAQAIAKLPPLTGWALLLACDLPYMTVTPLPPIPPLSDLAPNIVAVLPQGKKGWEPLCGLYRLDRLDNLQQFVRQGGRSFQRWLATEAVMPWPFTTPKLLDNCNTPTDWQRFQKDLNQSIIVDVDGKNF